MNVSSYEYFYTIAQGARFLDAAEEHNVSISSLSKAIKRMEEEYGVQLFDKSHRNAKLTPAGLCLYEYLKTLAPVYSEMQEFSEKRVVSCCTVPALPILGLRSIFLEFSAQYPNITLNLSRRNNPLDVLESLQAGQLDYAIMHRPHLGQDRLKMKELCDDTVQAILPPGHPLAARESLRFEDLGGEVFLLNEWSRSILDHICGRYGFPRPRTLFLELHRDDIILKVMAGEGVALFYQSDTTLLNLSEVCVRRLEDIEDNPLVLARSVQFRPSEAHKLFRRALVAAFSDRQPPRAARA